MNRLWSSDECKGQTLFSNKTPAGVVNLLSFPASSWGFPDGKPSCSLYSLVLMKMKLVGKVLLLTLGKRSQEAFEVLSFSTGQRGQHAKEKKIHYI